MRRREFIGLVGGAAAWPLAAAAQAPDRIARIGILVPGGSAVKQVAEAFREGLRDLGWVEGKNVLIEERFGDGERLPGLAAELVNLNVEIIVTGGEGVYAAHRVTAAVPIVMGASSDAVALGLAASLSHPGGNITGSTIFGPQLPAKRLELLKEIVSSLTRAGVLMLRGLPSNRLILDVMAPIAKELKVKLLRIEVSGESDYANALSTAASGSIGGLVLTDPAQFEADAAVIASIAEKHGLPTVGAPVFAARGGLLGYGVNFLELWRHAATFVDKILKGAKPGDIPIEQATRFHTIVNLKTAKAIGVDIPPLLLAGADEVIE